jgi:hypothetical protein
VPYLIGVLRSGPDWPDKSDQYRHVARCQAALYLGSLRDTRALEPLVPKQANGGGVLA